MMETSNLNPFIFSIKNENLKTYEKLSWFLILINISVLLFLGLKYQDSTDVKWIFVGAALIILATAYSFFGKKYRGKEMNYSVSFAVASFFWFEAGFIWPGIINILIMIFELITNRKLDIVVNETSITYPSFPKKEMEWRELSNLILKDGILTIDMKNNKLIQVNIEESATLVDEKEFNDFCRERITK
jgi:hypothetical protein